MPTACFLLDHFWGDRTGGAEWQTFVLCRALREHGWQVHYLAESVTGKTNETEEAHGIRVHWLPRLQWRSRIHLAQRRTFARVRELLDSIHPDLVYTRGNNCFTGIGATHRHKKSRAVKTIWGAAADWEISRRFYRDRLDYYARARWRKALLALDAGIKDGDHAREIEHADLLIAQTETQRRMFKERFNKAAIVLPSSHEVPDGPFLKSNPPTAVFVAHIGRRKRVELFVDLARACRDLEFRFVVVGDFTDAGYEAEVRARAANLPRVEFVGLKSKEETEAVIAAASLLVSTTDPGREGYPNVFIQAWLRQTPVVTLAFDPDHVIERHPFLGVAAHEESRMHEELRRLLGDPATLARMGGEAREWAIGRHSYEVNRDKIAGIFSAVLET